MRVSRLAVLGLVALLCNCAGGGDDVDIDLDSAFAGKGDELGKRRPAWDVARPLEFGMPLADQTLLYEPSIRTEQVGSDGSIEIHYDRPDDPWTEIGHYSVMVDEPGPLRIRLSGLGVSGLSAVIAIRPEAARTEVIAEQTRELEIDAEYTGEYKIVVIPMIFSARNQFDYTIEVDRPNY